MNLKTTILLILALGASSLLACADLMGRLAALRKRGGKLVVIDPRRTGTAERADEWLPIRPGADAALLMSWVQVLFDEGLVQLRHLEGRVVELGVVRERHHRRARVERGRLERVVGPLGAQAHAGKALGGRERAARVDHGDVVAEQRRDRREPAR